MKLFSLLLLFPFFPALAQPTPKDVEKVMQRDFHPRGQAGMDRIVQDGLQRVCTDTRDRPPAELARQLEADQMKTISFPQGSLIGDWKSGERIAQNGRGMQWTDAPGSANGGSCYNCHQLSPKEIAFGTIGPSLYQYGRLRGVTDPSAPAAAAIVRYTWTKLWDSKATNVCSAMPRFGKRGLLTESQLRDLMALLLDPKSSVNAD